MANGFESLFIADAVRCYCSEMRLCRFRIFTLQIHLAGVLGPNWSNFRDVRFNDYDITIAEGQTIRKIDMNYRRKIARFLDVGIGKPEFVKEVSTRDLKIYEIVSVVHHTHPIGFCIPYFDFR